MTWEGGVFHNSLQPLLAGEDENAPHILRNPDPAFLPDLAARAIL